MRFSERLKIASFRYFLREIPSLQLNNPSVLIKRTDVRAILRDIFRISSHGIYFSSLAISNTSDKIRKISDRIVEKSEIIKKSSESTEENFRMSQKGMGQERKNNGSFFLEVPTICPRMACHFNTKPAIKR